VPTGDRVELFADGTFLHLGREDDVVKLGGRRISLRSVEDAALAVDGVLDAVAAREVTQGLRGSRLWLFVATELTSAEVRRRLRARLEPIAVPRRIRVFPRLPRDERGKIPERVLRHLMGEE
jgi:acyl-coenzyme A synthetase/AMP-(fatty) acid ligase